jgi:predicted molibdopterin-dependent oxidoreductase YjgC
MSGSLPGGALSNPLFRRVAETGRECVAFTLDGEALTALSGDTVLTAVLTHRARLRRAEFSGEARAGFCLMGACQDCWMRTEAGERLRACTTFITPGMRLVTGRDVAP